MSGQDHCIQGHDIMAVNIYTGIGQRSSVQTSDQARINVRISPRVVPGMCHRTVSRYLAGAGGDRLEMLL